MSLNHSELSQFLERVGADTLEAYLDTHGGKGLDGLDRSLRWAAWNFRSGERTQEASFLMMHQQELRKILQMGEDAWRTRDDSVDRPKPQQERQMYDWDEEVTDIYGLAAPDLRIEFDEDEEDEEDAYSFGSAAGFALSPSDVTQPPPPQRDALLDAHRDLVERASLAESGLTANTEMLEEDDDLPEDSKDLLTFGTVAVDAPASPGWMPPPTDEPTVHSARAPVFMTPAPAPERRAASEPVFEARELPVEPEEPDEVATAPGVQREVGPQSNVAVVPLDRVDDDASEVSATAVTAPQLVLSAAQPPPKRVPLALSIAGIAVLVAVVSVVVTLGTLKLSEPTTPVATAPAPVAAPAPVVEPEPAVADVDPEPLNPDPVEPAPVDSDPVEPDPVEPDITTPEPATPPEPGTAVEPSPSQPEPVAAPAPTPVAEPTPAPEPVVAPVPQPVAAPEPAPAPQPVAQPAPEPVVAPQPAVVAPAPAPVVVAPAPEPPAPAAPSLTGTWAGTAGAGPMRLVISNQTGNTLSGSVVLTIGGNEETHNVSGSIDPSNGALSLSEIGGSASFAGTLSGTTARGTWRPAPGVAARQWFVVKR